MVAVPQTTKAAVFIGIGTGVLFLLGFATIALGASPSFVPLSLVIIVPTLLAGSFGGIIFGAAVGAAIAPLAFIFTARSIARSGRFLPKASVIAFVAAFVVSCALAIWGWKDTVEFTSVTRLAVLLSQSLAPPIFIAIYSLAYRTRMTFWRSITLHWLAFAWLSWSAFPWYGELL